MGVSLRCVKTGRSMELGYGGFMRWRLKIAELYNKQWYDHYALLTDLARPKSQEWYDAFNKETQRLIEEEGIDVKIVDFCFQSDAGGKINYGACRKILNAIGDYTDNYSYTYTAHADHDWDRLKAILQECVDTRSPLRWY